MNCAFIWFYTLFSHTPTTSKWNNLFQHLLKDPCHRPPSDNRTPIKEEAFRGLETSMYVWATESNILIKFNICSPQSHEYCNFLCRDSSPFCFISKLIQVYLMISNQHPSMQVFCCETTVNFWQTMKMVGLIQ